MFPVKCKKGSFAAWFLALCVLLAAFPVSASENLLVNPDWENGMDGWNTLEMDTEDTFQGESVLRSSVYQDVSLDGFAIWDKLKLSGNIATAPEDPSQKAIEMALVICDLDGNPISDVMQDGTKVQYWKAESEEKPSPAYHEIVLEVPPRAAFARVYLTIYKHSSDNPILFDKLCLEKMKTYGENGFVRSSADTEGPSDQGFVRSAGTDETVSTGTASGQPVQNAPVAEEAAEPVIEPDDSTYTVKNLIIPNDAATWNGHYYYYYTDPEITWSTANAFCYVANGHLVSITSAQEQAFLESAFPGTQGWIGASLQEDGSWAWTSGEAFDYTCWNAGEPNALNGTEAYAHLYTNMMWNDLPDDDTTFHSGYYCEWDSDTVTYKKDGLFGGDISDETRQLLEEGKGYYYGTGPEGPDIDKAWECFSKATDDYSGEAWYYLGEILRTDARGSGTYNYPRAMGSFERAVVYGYTPGWIGIADLFAEGKGIPADYSKAMELYQRALDLGAIEAWNSIGKMYEMGLGVDQNADTALQYYLQGAQAGDPDAMYSAAVFYEHGWGTQQNYELAREWYQKVLDSRWTSLYRKEAAAEAIAAMVSEEAAAAYEASTTVSDTSYEPDYGYQYETQPWEDPYFIGYTQDGVPQYSYDTWEYETQPWEDPYFIGYTQDGIPQYSYDTWEYETQPWEDPYFIGYTQDGVPQYSYDTWEYETQPWEDPYFIGYTQDGVPQYSY